MNVLEIRNLSKTFNIKSIPALKSISLTVKKGEILSLFGPSGTGKTSLLKIISGREPMDSGSCLIDGEVEWLEECSETDPNLTVDQILGQNLAGLDKELQRERKRELIALFSLFYKDQKLFGQLSLGEKKRVLLAKALAGNPSLLLMDEPFSSLDLILKNELKTEMRTLLKNENIACLFVSHDYQDVLSFSDSVVILDRGEIRQQGEPQTVFDFPRDAHIAKLLYECFLLPCQIKEFLTVNGKSLVSTTSEWGEFQFEKYHPEINQDCKRANILWLPHEISISSSGERGLIGVVIAVKKRGVVTDLKIQLNKRLVTVQVSNDSGFKQGDSISLGLNEKEGRLIPL